MARAAFGTTITIRIADDVRTAAEAAAKAEGRTLSGWIKRLVHQALRSAGTMPGEHAPGSPKAPLPETTQVERLKAALKPRRAKVLNDAAQAAAERGDPIRTEGDRILVIRCAQHKREACASCGWHALDGYPAGKALGGASVRYV